MQIDPLVEWQRLTDTYSKMYDAELLQLAADSADLTETAQQALGSEMQKRDLSLSRTSTARPDNADAMLERAATAPGVDPAAPELDSDTAEEEGTQHEYTWKTLLCGCDSIEEARQLSAALTKAGIENWIERPGSRNAVVSDDIMVGSLQVIVPADRLEEAHEVAARPIPKEIIEDLETEVPEYQPPVCPKCGAADPILESADPVNSWFCEACEHEWTESAEGEASNP